MLTASEREWLTRREQIREWDGCYVWDGYYEPETELENWQDALEFSERVAAKLAKEHEEIMLNAGVCEACFAWEMCFNGFEENDNAFCAFEMLKAARIAVEEEMDADKK